MSRIIQRVILDTLTIGTEVAGLEGLLEIC